MCGLTGFLSIAPHLSGESIEPVVNAMSKRLRHRGPDDAGAWCDPSSGIALGFRRLAIVDLSASGHQPMMSACGRYVIVFNGEIYNHPDLKAELVALGHSFRGRSDTEVLIEGFAEWGIEATIRRTIGMFAIALWDRQQQELTLIRDRLGKKPLYYAKFGETLLFASETKAFRAHPAFRPNVDRVAVAEFLRQSYLSQHSIYHRVVPLQPGTMLTIRRNDEGFWSESTLPSLKPFWSLREVITHGLRQPFTGSYAQAVSQLDALLTDAVGRRMEADVPLGAFLSGGIDSSLVVALMQKQSSRPVKTFTMGFVEEAFNEAPYALRVAQYLKTDHTEMIVTADQALEVIPLLPHLFDEPFADSSQIPTYLVSQLARRNVTVALSGDGGDELFCGYRRYFEALDGYFQTPSTTPNRWLRAVEWLRKIPAAIRTPIGRICQCTGRLPPRRLTRLLTRVGDVLCERGPSDRYLRNLSHWRDLDQVVLGISRRDCDPPQGDPPQGDRQQDDLSPFETMDSFFTTNQRPTMAGFTIPQLIPGRSPDSPREFQQAWQAYDTGNYLPSDILTKVDRASMGVSLEARTPLLDHRVVEFAWSLPHEFKVEGRTGKKILRDVLARYVPRDLFERPKVGFGVPIGDWLRGPLQNWAENLLNERRIQQEGFFQPPLIRQKWAEHLGGRADWSYLLWDVLMFQAWLEIHPIGAD